MQTKLDGSYPSDAVIKEYKLTPSLQAFVALARRSPSWVTTERENVFDGCLDKAMKPADSQVKSNWFVDDNDFYVPQGGRIKPIFNAQVKSDDIQALKSLNKTLHGIAEGDVPYTAIWPKDSDLGLIHMEGGKWVPRMCYVGKYPSSLERVPAPPPIPDPIKEVFNQKKSCAVQSIGATSSTEGEIVFLPVESADECTIVLTDSATPGSEVERVALKGDSLHTVTVFHPYSLTPGSDYQVSVECSKNNRGKICSPGENMHLVTPKTNNVPGRLLFAIDT